MDKESKLKKSINDYELAIEEYGSKLDEIKNKINEALFEEEIFTVKSKINDQLNIVRIIQDYTTNNYLIPIFTDKYEYLKAIENYKLKDNVKVEPYKTRIYELIDLANTDPEFSAIIINPYSQNFIIDMTSVIEYYETYLK